MMTYLNNLIWLCLLTCLVTPAYGEKIPATLTLHTQYEFPPYVTRDQDQRLDGHSIAVVKCVAEQLGIDLKLHSYPWPRAQQHVQNGTGDGFFPASQNPRRDQFATLSAPVSPQRWYWYLPKNSSLDPGSPEFLKTAQVGARLGSNMYHWLKKNHYQLTYYTSNWETLVRALRDHRVEAILANDATTDPILNELQLTGAYRKELCLNMPLGVYFSHRLLKKYPHFLDLFNAEISSCQRPLQQY